MSCHYRCSKCRSRNVLPKALFAYKRTPRCKSCNYQRFFIDKERTTRQVCRCEGAYHWPSHRPKSPYCMQNPNVFINRARRAGATDEELAELSMELSLAGVGGRSDFPPGMVPF